MSWKSFFGLLFDPKHTAAWFAGGGTCIVWIYRFTFPDEIKKSSVSVVSWRNNQMMITLTQIEPSSPYNQKGRKDFLNEDLLLLLDSHISASFTTSYFSSTSFLFTRRFNVPESRLLQCLREMINTKFQKTQPAAINEGIWWLNNLVRRLWYVNQM